MLTNTKAFQAGLLVTILLLTCFLLEQSWTVHRNFAALRWQDMRSPSVESSLHKPENITVSGLIFYGRRDKVSCLWPYLKENLIDNGGWLDEILWIVNTDNKEDIEYLEEITAANPARHKKVDFSQNRVSVYTYWKAWEHIEPGKYYVKIDDDILWMDDVAIPRLVSTKLKYPEAYFVSGNIINNPPLGFMHLHMGAIRPFLPENDLPAKVPKSWKPSQHGPWRGEDNFEWNMEIKPPYDNHRWLRVQDDRMLPQTPIWQIKYEVWEDSYKNWGITAQQHYSLLDAIEKDELERYMWKKPWYMYGERIRINFMCIYSDDVLSQNMTTGGGDEDNIAMNFPKKLRRPVMIAGDALAAHFQYQGQDGLEKTDLLSRYRMLAEEKAALHNTTLDDATSTAPLEPELRT